MQKTIEELEEQVRVLTRNAKIDQIIIDLLDSLVRLNLKALAAKVKGKRGLKTGDSVKNGKKTSSKTPARAPQARGKTTVGITQ